MSKTKKYVPTKNVGIAPAGATKAELVWLNLTPNLVRKISGLNLGVELDVMENISWLENPQEFDRLVDTHLRARLGRLAAKAGWRRTHPK